MYDVSKALKTVFSLSGKLLLDAAETLELTKGSLYNKFQRNSFTADEFITLIDLCGADLIIEYQGQRIRVNDLKKI